MHSLDLCHPTTRKVSRETNEEIITYLYRGLCPATNQELTLPRTRQSETLALELSQTLDSTEPKMYGILIVEDQNQERFILKAFSGKLDGTFHKPGWAPPMLELESTPLEVSTKARLAELKIQIIELSQDSSFQDFTHLRQHWAKREEELMSRLRARRQARNAKRESNGDKSQLDQESRDDSRQKREFKSEREKELEPLRTKTDQITDQILGLKRERKMLSRQLQKELHQAFGDQLWAGEPWSIASLFPAGPPTGTGECCAPKLLHYAKKSGLRPVAMAEFWWGPQTANRSPGVFYPACKERCQPLLGALLHQSSTDFTLETLFEDEHILVVVKPSGVLTVPGRQNWNQDSLVHRLSKAYPGLSAVHRLDLETSGIVLLAKNKRAHSACQKLFSDRQIRKVYQALLSKLPDHDEGRIELALASDPSSPGRYLALESGKTAITEFRVLDGAECRVEFIPTTGRSHQLRIHSATGLDCPIRGDKLYNQNPGTERLMLHAQTLEFTHPFTNEPLKLHSQAPF